MKEFLTFQKEDIQFYSTFKATAQTSEIKQSLFYFAYLESVLTILAVTFYITDQIVREKIKIEQLEAVMLIRRRTTIETQRLQCQLALQLFAARNIWTDLAQRSNPI